MAWFIHSPVGILFGRRLDSIVSPPAMTLFSVYKSNRLNEIILHSFATSLIFGKVFGRPQEFRTR